MKQKWNMSKSRSVQFALLVLLLAFPGLCHAGWQLVWSDEFNGTSVDTTRWTFDTGNGASGWGNNEREFYTSRTNNAHVAGGTLRIIAKRESMGGFPYTSARLKSQGLFSKKYGRFEFRAKLPQGLGCWPALWMLGTNISSVGWPACGEIDIMENIGKEPNQVHGTIHGPGHSGGQSIGAAFTNPGGRAFADDFHVFTVEWEPNVIRWYVDGTLYQTRTPADLPPGARWVYDHPFFLLLNVAVGGNWPGNPDGTTVFPQEMRVDWVRVYARPGGASRP